MTKCSCLALKLASWSGIYRSSVRKRGTDDVIFIQLQVSNNQILQVGGLELGGLSIQLHLKINFSKLEWNCGSYLSQNSIDWDWNLADTRQQEAEQEAELAEAFERLKLERPEWMPRSPPHDQQSTTSR
ncbi:hypothetical protein CFP56_018120 [Quercus suber]|uniref:Uncharacterized protein n=1 Tax=Quercus suber TaxID=58331 RepID=A0AAW0KIL0_QUESU